MKLRDGVWRMACVFDDDTNGLMEIHPDPNERCGIGKLAGWED